MHHIDKFFRESYYSIVRILLIACGLWPFQQLNIRYAIYIGSVVLFGSGISFEVFCIIKVWPDFFEVFNCLSMILFAISSMIKFIYMVYKLSMIKKLILNIQEHWCSPMSDEEAKILHSYVLFARRFSYVYSSVIFGHGAMFVITPVVIKFFFDKENASNKTQDAQVESTYQINYMLDLQMEYNSLLIQSIICEMFYVLVLTSINVLYIMCVEHCCGLFEALRYRLESAIDFENTDNDIISTQNKCYSNIVYSVRRHTQAIQFATSIESLCRLPLFLHMTVNVSLLSIIGFQIITNPEDLNRLTPYGSYLSGLVLNMFLENWQGQKIMDCNERVHESAYKLQWYKMPIISQKLLVMIMLRSGRPLRITAGKVLALSYVTFNSAIRTGFSFLMLLRSLE